MQFIHRPKDVRNYPIWSRASRREYSDPFCSGPIWQLSFHDAFSPKRRLLIAEEGNSAIAFAENRFFNGRVILTPIEPLWFSGCPLLGKEATELLGDALEYWRTCYSKGYPRILLSGILQGSVLEKRLLRMLRNEFDIYLHSIQESRSASLSGGMDGWLSRRSGNFRSKLKKSVRKAGEAGVTFERCVPDSPQMADALYERILAVERTSWKGLQRCGIADNSPHTEFYQIMLRRLSVTGDARIVMARVGNRDIGYIFGCLSGRKYRGQQCSYDEEWKSLSIGNLLQLETIRWLVEEGCSRYDMGPGNGDPAMAYKRHWAEKAIRTKTWLLEKN